MSENIGKLPNHWLVMRLSALGDVALLSGVLEYWRARHGWSFTVLTRPNFAPALENHPAITELVTPGPDLLRGRAMLGFFRRLAREHAGSGLLDLHGTMRSCLLAGLWRGPVRRYPKQSVQRRLFLRSGRGPEGKVNRARAGLLAHNVTQRYALAVEAEAPPASLLLPHIFLRAEEELWAKDFLRELFPHVAEGGPKPVALHPFATHALKAWPAEHWRALVAGLETMGRPWLIFGRGEALFPASPYDLSNSTSLREMCALLANCALLVTGDSGPMHLACGVGAPVLGLFGPTVREWGFFPAGAGDRVLELPLPCRPCSLHGGNGCPRGHECMQKLTPQIVLEKLQEML